jgi:hypothetical protein
MEWIDLAESIIIIGCVCVPIFAGMLMARQEADETPAEGSERTQKPARRASKNPAQKPGRDGARR